ncbi:hypothetical protein Peetri_00043 [Pseudomonas phage vB_PpuM-Peetri]
MADELKREVVPAYKFDTLVAHSQAQEEMIAKLTARNNHLELYARNDVWHWQKDGGNFLESLTCPVVIDPADMRAFLLDNNHATRLKTVADKFEAFLEEEKLCKEGLQKRLTRLATLANTLVESDKPSAHPDFPELLDAIDEAIPRKLVPKNPPKGR